jgi:RNA polymerase sigma factor FliA
VAEERVEAFADSFPSHRVVRWLRILDAQSTKAGSTSMTATVVLPTSERDRAIGEHLPLVRQVVRRLALQNFGTACDIDDLVGYGTVGLIQAVDRFDPNSGIPFAAFATLRIRGAVLDAVRQLDPLSRDQRSHVTRIRDARDHLRSTLNREPTVAEVRDASQMAPDAFDDAAVAATSSFMLNADDDDAIAISHAPSCTEIVERKERAELVQAAVSLLPERERAAVQMYFFKELTQREISCALALSETRVSQLISHDDAFARRSLRSRPRLR